MARKLRVEIDGDSTSGRKALDDVAAESDLAAKRIDKLGEEFRQAAKDGDKLEGSLKNVDGTTKKASESVTGLGRVTDRAAEEFRAAARAAEKFDASLAATRTEITRLNRELASTNDVDKTVKELQKQYSEFDKISRIKKRIQQDDEVARKSAAAFAAAAKKDAERLAFQAKRDGRGVLGNTLGDLFGLGKGALRLGGKAASGAATNLSEVTGAIPGGGTAVKAGLAIGAAPVIGGAIGGAALAGAGILGVGAGIGGAIANNPEPFQKAWTAAIQDVSRRWQDASTGFEKPALSAFATIKNAVDDVDIEGPFKEAEKFVQPLALGIGGFLTEFGNGLGDLIKDAGPVIDVLEKDLPLLGKSFKAAFDEIGGSAGDSAEAFDDVLQFVGQSIIAVGTLISVLSKAYVGIKDFGMGVASLGGLIHVFDQTDPVMSYGRALDGASRSTWDAVASQKALAQAASDARDALRTEVDQMLGLEGANDAVVVAQKNLKKSFEDNGGALQGNSDAALANREILRQLQKAYEEQWTAAVDAAHNSAEGIHKANEAYLAHLEEVRAIATAHGANTTELDKYIEHLKRVDGLTTDFYIYTHFVNVGTPSERRSTGESRAGGQENYASGGTMDFSGVKRVGEHGAELIWGSKGQYVSTAAETRRLMSMMSSTGGSGGGSGGGGRGGDLTIGVAAGSDSAVGQLIQLLFARQLIQVYDSTGRQISTRPS